MEEVWDFGVQEMSAHDTTSWCCRLRNVVIDSDRHFGKLAGQGGCLYHLRVCAEESLILAIFDLPCDHAQSVAD